MPPPPSPIPLRDLGVCEYSAVWRDMQARVDHPQFQEEIWTLEHFPVYTLGQSAIQDDILNPQNIPVVQSDRGGRATYHAPGQAVAYPLIDLRARKIPPKKLVDALQNAVVQLLQNRFHIPAHTKPRQPGVYVQNAKIAALGLRIRRGRAYHGVSLNASCNLQPFQNINPCGIRKLPVTRLADLGVQEPSHIIRQKLGASIANHICDKFPHK